jgi:ATP-dependent exoDNAse (exonuclease V) beta subunit
LYVAFTRAINSLYVFTPAGSKNGIKYTGDLLYRIVQGSILSDGSKEGLAELLLERSTWNDHSLEWTIGEESGKISLEEDLPQEKMLELEHPVTLPGKRLRLALHKTDYFELDDKSRQARISRGNLMHELFEHIITADDVDRAIERLVISGKISVEEKEQMKNSVLEKINDPLVSDWFTKKWKVKTESDILVKNEKIQRPDRVMIRGEKAVVVDYKFGEVEEESHESQLGKYIRVFQRMGFADVTGFIWYVELNRITEVFV